MTHDPESRFHAEWLGLVQPVEGLVVSVPVLADAQCMRRQPLALQQRLADLSPAATIADLPAFLAAILDWTPDLYDSASELPAELALYVPEGHQTLRPTLALRHLAAPASPAPSPAAADDSTPASRAGAPYVALLWDLPPSLPLDRPETTTGPWDYPPAAKFDRLLRACRVPIGLLTNRTTVRLVYAPHGESSGHIDFRVEDLASVSGRAIFDAFVMLLSAERFFGVAPEHQLPALLRDSRTRQANVTNELADQMLDALRVLLAGFVAAAERDGRTSLDDALARDDDHLYKGLLTLLLRLVFVLYAEDRALLPIDQPTYAEHLSALGLFDQLQRDHGEFPDSMARRFGAWPRLVALFRAVFLGLEHGPLVMPARRGELFDPHRFPFLEGWGPAGSAPIDDPFTQGRVRVPTVDDETVFRVLERLLVFQGQRLSYRALDVEQIGAVYEALMGYHVVRLAGPALCVKGGKGARIWITAAEVLTPAPAQRAQWVAENAALAKSAVAKIAEPLRAATTDAQVLAALEALRVRGSVNGVAGQLVIQPGAERRRTSSHYTPASLTAPIVRRTLEPLLAAMGATPASERLLDLKVCDPAMGSGAFLVEACRFLGDQVVAAWTREGRLDLVASTHGDVVLHARRLVAQRCLYGVDKNPLAVSLARLSLWLVTLAKDEPFTFVDHALRHGDSLVGLDVEQIRSFHWKPGAQMELARDVIDTALHEALDARQGILGLAAKDDTREKERLLWDANDALQDVRLIADLVVGAFFAADKDKAREAERVRRRDLVVNWLESRQAPPAELLAMQAALRERVPAFHWWVEFPEVFYGERADPLDGDRVNRVAWMDAFVGNPPFMGGSTIPGPTWEASTDWLGNHSSERSWQADLAPIFFTEL
ncbi:MAG: N-6 DNA methylase [Deltaproteobacteria bacterium]|nr:N-6 DNA methylase [Deltaproteobacteria bacterium]